MAGFAGPKRPQNGAFTGSSFMSAVARKNASTAPKASKQAKAEAAHPSGKAASRPKTPKSRNAQARENLRVVVS